MQRTNLASAECYLRWQAADVLCTDRQFFGKVDFWCDILPGDLGTRPADDKYYPRRLLADPVYAVWGTRSA